MPVLDATALETDPDGMAFLRSVIGTEPEKAPPASSARRRRLARPSQGCRKPEPAWSETSLSATQPGAETKIPAPAL
jgi:hypothetical protein